MSWLDVIGHLRDADLARIRALELAGTLRDKLAATPGYEPHAARAAEVCRTLDLRVPPELAVALPRSEGGETTQPTERPTGGLAAVRGIWRDRVRDVSEDLSAAASSAEVACAGRAARERTSESGSGRLTREEWERLVAFGVIGGPIELIFGRAVMRDYEVVFPPAQARAAADLGVTVRSCVDAVLEDGSARAELTARLAAGYSPEQEDR